MIRIEAPAWRVMLEHARRCYPEECCGAMLGESADGSRRVVEAVPLVNAHPGPRTSRYQIRPEDLIAVEKQARRQGLELVGIYHSHPDCSAYFSQTDLENGCPWYCFVVLSIREGQLAGAGCWIPRPDLSGADQQELVYPQLPSEERSCPKS